MRLIDADAIIPTEVHTVVVLKDGREQLESVLYAEQIDDAPTVEPAVTRWHRVDEPPQEEGRYWIAVWFAGHWIFDAAWYTHDISEVIDVPCCERVSGFYRGNTEVHPDYWMPIEPPKEEEV